MASGGDLVFDNGGAVDFVAMQAMDDMRLKHPLDMPADPQVIVMLERASAVRRAP